MPGTRLLLAAFLALSALAPALSWAQPIDSTCAPCANDPVAKLLADLAGLPPGGQRTALLKILADNPAEGACDKRSVRYAAATALDSLLVNGPAAERGALFDDLLAAAAKEKDPALRRQMAINLDRARAKMTPAQQAKSDAILGDYLPQSPHYPTVFGEDGTKTAIDVTVHTSNSEGRFENYKRAFAGSKITPQSDGSMIIEYKVTPDDPTGRYKPVTYKIHVKDEASHFDVFNAMKEGGPAVEVFNYHSGYGRNLSESIRNGQDNPESKKIWFLGNCKSRNNASRIMGKYPKLGGFFTFDSQYTSDTPPAVKKLLAELANRSNWEQISRSLNSISGHDDNYLFPHDRRRLKYLDSDLDGIPDAWDTGVDCGLVDPPKEHDYTAKKPVDGALSGEKLVYAHGVANGMLGYGAKTSGMAEKYVTDGWAPADLSGPPLLFSKGADGLTKVKVNAAYSHLSDVAMAGLMMREMVIHDRTGGGRREPTLDDKIVAYGMAVHLFDSWYESVHGGGVAYESFQKKYSLGRNIPLYTAASSIDHDDAVTDATIAAYKKLLNP